MVVACKVNPDTLRNSAADWLKVRGVNEIVLVDWSSEEKICNLWSVRFPADPE